MSLLATSDVNSTQLGWPVIQFLEQCLNGEVRCNTYHETCGAPPLWRANKHLSIILSQNDKHQIYFI